MGVEGRLSKLAHVSNLLGLVARAQSDLLYLQSFMVIASGTTAWDVLAGPRRVI